MSAITLSGVTKAFGQVRALDDVSVDVAEGELLALLGPSGCGKTTLLRIVAGLEQPDAGRVVIGGVDMTDRSTRLRPIGMVFQSYALFPNLTVRANVAFPLEVRRWPRRDVDERVEELLQLVRLVPEADRYPNQISGGQAQRCALARALAPRPHVLLLDEPLSALDVVVRAHLRDEIRRVQRQVSTTTIYVTHDQSEALAIADRVAVMNHGRIEQLGSPMEVYAGPTSVFSAGFVGNRNAVEVPVRGGRAVLGKVFDVPAPAGSNGRVVAYFAPEDVRLGKGGEGAAGEPASIEAVVFHGAITRVHVRADIDERSVRFVADVPTREAAWLEHSSLVHVRVAPDDVSSFPRDDPHPAE
jgi:putative spermidine/putrescine transport system ATP-binding protein